MISSANTRGLYDEDVEPRDDFRGRKEKNRRINNCTKNKKIYNISAKR